MRHVFCLLKQADEKKINNGTKLISQVIKNTRNVSYLCQKQNIATDFTSHRLDRTCFQLNHLVKQRTGTLGHGPACVHCKQPADSLLVERLAVRCH